MLNHILKKHAICLEDNRIRPFLVRHAHGDLCKHLGIDSSTDLDDRYLNLFLNAYINCHVHTHRVASTPELATNFVDYKQMAGMTTVRKSCYFTVLSRRYALRWIYFYLNIFIFEIHTQQ